MSAASSYSASDITVLTGLEPVRKRRHMYIGSTDEQGLHHLVWEIVDNSIDEVMNGFASFVEVELQSDGCTIRVTDNGRGIPVDIHPESGKPALELILTTLHAGGKFEGGNYTFSGGLHGVGASVVNALALTLVAEVKRDGILYRQSYSKGIPDGPLEEVGEARGTGTAITFTPDPEIFPNTTYNQETILEVLEGATDHPDVEELHRRVSAIEPGVNIATVYRTVRLFEESGILTRHDFGDGRSRYEEVADDHHDPFFPTNAVAFQRASEQRCLLGQFTIGQAALVAIRLAKGDLAAPAFVQMPVHEIDRRVSRLCQLEPSRFKTGHPTRWHVPAR